MSGVEAIGLVLGALPLMISAMEHYEDSRKVVSNWWQFKRAYRKDLGRLRDCELKFQLSIKELLLPLRKDGTISDVEYNNFLVKHSGSSWTQADIQEALADRLSDCHERYLEIMQELEKMLSKLAIMTKVNDEKFQAVLHAKKEAVNKDALDQGIGSLVTSANHHLSFQVKRLNHTFTAGQREALIDELERQINTLSHYLQTSDRIAKQTGTTGSGNSRSTKRRFKSLLSFWTHADHTYRLMRKAWKCPCSSLHRAYVRLPVPSSHVQMDMLMQFSSETKPSSSIPWINQNMLVSLRKEEEPLVHVQRRQVRFDSASASGLVEEIKIGAFASGIGLPSHTKATKALHCDTINVPTTAPKVSSIGPTSLCSVAQKSGLGHECTIELLSDDTSKPGYDVCCTASDSTCSTFCRLDDLIARKGSRGLWRVERLAMAYIITSSFLRLFPSSWLPGTTATENILLDLAGTLHPQAFIIAEFNDTTTTATRDSVFVELGILLLELCFNTSLDNHSLWKNDAAGPLPPTHPLMRKVVASEWSKEVQFEADVDYATAVDWCIHRATLKDAEWRVDFAQHVIGPLQKCYETVIKVTGSRP